jgi:bilirubin oxidase
MKKQLHKLSLAAALALMAVPAVHAQWNIKFENSLAIPSLLTGPTFVLNADSGTVNFDSAGSYVHAIGGTASDSINKPFTSWGYNGGTTTYLGPTMIWETGSTVNITLNNNLDDTITTHWHGGNFDPRNDGGPQEPVPPGTTWNPSFPVLEGTETMWYHSHQLDKTTEQVQLGLAGLIIVQDATDPLLNSFPNDYGVDDIPLVIQEKGFLYDTTTQEYTGIDVGEGNNGRPRNQFFTMVNGVYAPSHLVPDTGYVRFRILNGSIRKTFQFGFSTSLTDPTSEMVPFTVFATDGGYMDYSFEADSLIIMPGERYEVAVNMTGIAKDSVYMINYYKGIGDGLYVVNSGGGTASSLVHTAGYAFAAFVRSDTVVSSAPKYSIPTLANPWDSTGYAASVDTSRSKVLSHAGAGQPWLIADSDTSTATHYHLTTINDFIRVNSREQWTIYNNTGVAHPFHIHKIEFRVVQIDSMNAAGTTVEKSYVYPDLPPEMLAHKDVVRVMPNWKLTWFADFDSFPAPYDADNAWMYHCHILTHEDISMMHQFVVVSDSTYDSLMTLVKTLEEKPFILFPNPTTNEVRILGSNMQHGNLYFTDALGRVLKEEHIHHLYGNFTFDVSDLPRGLVLVTWRTEDGQYEYTTKMLLE